MTHDAYPEVSIAYPLAPSVTGEHLPFLQSVKALVVDSAQHYENAAACLKRLNAIIAGGEALFKPIKAQADALHSTICAQERLALDPFRAEKQRLSQAMGAWSVEQERQRQLAQAKAQEEAQLAEALQHEALGDQTAAEQAMQGHGLVSVSVPSSVPKVEGVSTRETYSVEVTDLLALVKAVAAEQAPLAYLQANVTALGQSARALKSSFVVPGVRVVRSMTAVGRVR